MAVAKKLVPGDALGQWIFIEEIDDGRGGNSEVWRAEDASGREAAVKVLRRRDRVARFRDEISDPAG